MSEQDKLMPDQLEDYKRAAAPLPQCNRVWPLYGAGFENLGRDGMMIEVPMPNYGPDELFVRHDACGICFSDIKVIRVGQSHPRIYRDISVEPVVLGHEVSMTVVGVGEKLRDQYAVGDRFMIQADIYVGGVGYAYGYEIQGGYSLYNVIDQRVLNGDEGNYLLPVGPETGYAEAALNEPWACVEASYNVEYRTQWLDGGTVWLVGNGRGIRLGAAEAWRPRQVVLDLTDEVFSEQVRSWAAGAGVEVVPDDGAATFDDIVVQGADEELIERAFTRLANGGVFNVVAREPLSRRVRLDVGRLHYDHLALIGTEGPDLSAAYTPIRTQLRPGGTTWMLGAGGPMGHMHTQRALEVPEKPGKVVATNLRPTRIRALEEKFAAPAAEQGVDLVCFAHQEYDDSARLADRLRRESGGRGFDDIVVNAPSTAAIEEAEEHLADQGVMNIFAGLPRGTMAAFDLNAVIRRGVRYTGTSGSSIADLRHMKELMESHALSPNRSVAAIASLEGVADGLRAVAEGRFPGKVVIYPHIRPLPLTPLSELKGVLPSVYAKLRHGREWTAEAEAELLRTML